MQCGPGAARGAMRRAGYAESADRASANGTRHPSYPVKHAPQHREILRVEHNRLRRREPSDQGGLVGVVLVMVENHGVPFAAWCLKYLTASNITLG